ncbi:hypothetical protein ACE09Y_02245 [Raphidiopsis sp. BLCC-F218]
MQVIEKNSLFAQVSGEQSAVVSGGTAVEAAQVFALFRTVTAANTALTNEQLVDIFLVNISG